MALDYIVHVSRDKIGNTRPKHLKFHPSQSPAIEGEPRLNYESGLSAIQSLILNKTKFNPSTGNQTADGDGVQITEHDIKYFVDSIVLGREINIGLGISHFYNYLQDASQSDETSQRLSSLGRTLYANPRAFSKGHLLGLDTILITNDEEPKIILSQRKEQAAWKGYLQGAARFIPYYPQFEKWNKKLPSKHLAELTSEIPVLLQEGASKKFHLPVSPYDGQPRLIGVVSAPSINQGGMALCYIQYLNIPSNLIKSKFESSTAQMNSNLLFLTFEQAKLLRETGTLSSQIVFAGEPPNSKGPYKLESQTLYLLDALRPSDVRK